MKSMITGIVFFLLSAFGGICNAAVQQSQTFNSAQEDATFFEPHASQSFSFDKKHEIIAAINQTDNEIVIISHKGDGKLDITHRFPVDNVSGRRDEQHIYRPTAVAIYDGYVTFLASHRDSCYFAVLNLNGKLEKRLTFPGYASAFTYHRPSNELYISGENENGLNVIVLDIRNGINRVDMKDVSILHDQKSHMTEEITGRTLSNTDIIIILVSVVLFTLLLLFYLLAVQKKRRTQKVAETKVEPKQEVVVSNVAVSDGVYAAIAAAIYLYGEELHDVENTVLTINKVSRTYSPWSSKIHGLNTYFRR